MKAFASLFTAGRVFVGILLLIMTYFLWNGSETVMTKFGMETKSSLRAALATQTQAAEVAVKANKTNSDTIKDLQAENRRLANALGELKKKDEKTVQITVDTQTNLKKKVDPIKTQIAKKKIVTDKVIMLPTAEVNAKSEANISALHDTYDKFFADVPDAHIVSITPVI
jgi:hypothetical protein